MTKKRIVIAFAMALIFSIQVHAEIFSIATANILMHAYYIKNSYEWVIDVQDRLAAFEEFLQILKSKTVDIICFQEWPYGATEITSNDLITVISHDTRSKNSLHYYQVTEKIGRKDYHEKSQDIFQNGVQSLLYKYFPENNFSYVRDPHKTTGDGVYTVFNHKKFKLQKTETPLLESSPGFYLKDKRAVIVSLAFKKNPRKKIMVVNVHIPFIYQKLPDNPYAITNLTLIKNYLDKQENNYKIVCGDFNFNGLNEHNNFFSHRLMNIKQIFPHYKVSLEELPCATHNGDHRGKKGLALDYIIYSPGLNARCKTTIPGEVKFNQRNQLIIHKNYEFPSHKQFVSDHAALFYTFKA